MLILDMTNLKIFKKAIEYYPVSDATALQLLSQRNWNLTITFELSEKLIYYQDYVVS